MFHFDFEEKRDPWNRRLQVAILCLYRICLRYYILEHPPGFNDIRLYRQLLSLVKVGSDIL